MAKIVLWNRAKRHRRMLVLNLTKSVAAVTVENRTSETNKRGETRKRVSTKMVPDSLRIPAGAKVMVDSAVLQCPEVAKQIKARNLVVLGGE